MIFCGDCGNKFEPGESKVCSGNSAVYGEYFPKSDTPICDKCAELRYTEHKLKVEEARERNRELAERLDKGRDYLMTVKPSDLTVEDCLEAFGFGRNGLEG